MPQVDKVVDMSLRSSIISILYKCYAGSVKVPLHFGVGCEYNEVLMNVWPKMGFGTQLLEQCNLFKAKEFLCVWVVLLSAKSVEVSVSNLLSSAEFVRS